MVALQLVWLHHNAPELWKFCASQHKRIGKVKYTSVVALLGCLRIVALLEIWRFVGFSARTNERKVEVASVVALQIADRGTA